jgi:cytochrome c oxidase cbb3-type subunit I/II
MYDPTSMSAGSLMPSYTHMFENPLDTTTTKRQDRGDAHHGCSLCRRTFLRMRTTTYRHNSRQDRSVNLKKDGIDAQKEMEIIAVIAYLQRVGTDIKAKEVVEAKPANP